MLSRERILVKQTVAYDPILVTCHENKQKLKNSVEGLHRLVLAWELVASTQATCSFQNLSAKAWPSQSLLEPYSLGALGPNFKGSNFRSLYLN